MSIGLPVFNGEKYLEEALDSILAQTFQDFELIISDNASTDRTQEICQAYVEKDNRVRYYRNARNLGLVMNFNRVFNLASGEYFKWAACDDVLAPDFLIKCVRILDQDPSVVLCHSKTGIINSCSKLVGKYTYKVRYEASKPHERFADLICMRYSNWFLIFGVIRSSALEMTQLFGSYIGSDRNLLAEISLINRFYEIPEILFFRRTHPEAATEKGFTSYKEKLDWWTKQRKQAIYLPKLINFLEYFKSVRQIPLSWFERQRCYLQIIKWLMREGWMLIGINLVQYIFSHSSARARAMFRPLVEWFIDRGGIEKGSF